MGHRELTDSLRRDGDEQVNRLWNEVRAEAEKINAGTAQRTSELREEFRKRLEAVSRKEEDAVLSEAVQKARAIRLSLEHTLSDRLLLLAVSCLGELRDSGYRDVFASLAGELPSAEWDEVRVNPLDKGIAEEFFPGSRIITDDNISGGLEVTRHDNKICVNNTFEKRLEKAWQDILLLLIRDICGEDGQ